MIAATLTILFLVAAAAWVAALVSAIAIMQIAPSGHRLSSLFRLGWLRFSTLETELGPASLPHLRRYRTAIFAFLACVIALAALSILLAAGRTN